MVFFGTIAKRTINHIYVANWFFGALIIGITVLHVFNSLELPVSAFKSYSIYAGSMDAMVQWWYGHNAVGFFLTAGFLGIMYYFVPKQAERPVYSYRLSIVHFWALIAIYVWAGPHHLHYSSLPDWAQSLGMVMSLVLLAPSWGGMINGIMTLSGAWDKLRTDPILKFLIVSLSFYGMSTFEGPMMSIKTVNALSHNTDWTIGHVHSGALGWVAMVSIGAMYHLIPIMYGRKQGEMYSVRLINVHFWLATLGTVMYIASMWVNGLIQGLMWRATNVDGTLTYSFVESLEASYPGYYVRALGGAPVPRRHAGHGIQRLENGDQFRDAPGQRHCHTVSGDRTLEMSGIRTETNLTFLIALTLVAVCVGGMVEIFPQFFNGDRSQPIEGLQAAAGAASSKAATSTSAKAVTSVTRRWCDRCAPRPSATGTTPWPAKTCTSIRSCGAASGQAPIWRVSAVATVTTGIAHI